MDHRQRPGPMGHTDTATMDATDKTAAGHIVAKAHDHDVGSTSDS